MRFFISKLNLDEAQVQQKRKDAQKIEDSNQSRIERCRVGKARKQPNHIMLSLRPFVGLEWNRYTGGISRWTLKQDIIRPAVGAYLPEPRYILVDPTA